MFNTSTADTKTNKSSINANPRNVYYFIPDWILFRTKAMHYLQFGIFNSGISHML